MKFDKKIQALWGPQVFFDLLDCQTSEYVSAEKRLFLLQSAMEGVKKNVYFFVEVNMIFREMRQKKQELSRQEIADILHKGTSGVLALLGDNDYPYAVPISYVYDDGKIYFHSAKSGHKIDAIQRTEKASFCVIDKDLVVPEEYTTYFRSVIAFGQIRIIEGDLEKRAAIEKLAIKYAPEDTAASRDHAINRGWKPLCMLEMTIDHITGKEAIGLVKEKEKLNRL